MTLRAKRRRWTPAQIRTLRKLYPNMRTDKLARRMRVTEYRVYNKAFALGLHKSARYLAGPDACRLRRGDNVGAAYRFKPGQPPPNKGLRRPGYSPGRMKETQFKKGQRNGTAAAHFMPIGATRLVEGYVMLKVAEVPNVAHTVNWKLLHVLNWERENGRPFPAGHCLWFLDRNRENVEASNLELITRAENMRRNTYHRYPKDIANLIQLRGALMRQINRRTNGKQAV